MEEGGEFQEELAMRNAVFAAADALPADFSEWSPEQIQNALTCIEYRLKDITEAEWDELEAKSRRMGLDWKNLFLKMLNKLKSSRDAVASYVCIIAFTIRRGTRLQTWKKFQNGEAIIELEEAVEEWGLKSGAGLEKGDFSAMRLLRLSGGMGGYISMKLFSGETTALHYIIEMPFFPSLFHLDMSPAMTMTVYTAFLKGAWNKAKVVKCNPPMILNPQWLNGQTFIWRGIFGLQKSRPLCTATWEMMEAEDQAEYVHTAGDGTQSWTEELLISLNNYIENLEDPIRAYVRNVTIVDITPGGAAIAPGRRRQDRRVPEGEE